MKKFVLFFALFLAVPAFAICSIDAGESVCSLPEFREKVRPIYNESSGSLGSPSVNLQPLKREDPINQMRGPNNDLNYNSGCQFGVCLRNPNESRLPYETGD